MATETSAVRGRKQQQTEAQEKKHHTPIITHYTALIVVDENVKYVYVLSVPDD